MRREMSVAGTFYPARDIELERYFKHFTGVYDENLILPNIYTKAIIVPHAGYIYSGYTANIAYRVLQKSNIKNFVVIGPSHKISFDGISLSNFENFKTPFGDIKSANEIQLKLQNKFNLSCLSQAHQEHSTEVQFPFVKYYLDDANIVELIYSKVDSALISEIIEYILKQKECGVIISTDLSHFHPQEDANKLDSICLDAIKKLDIDLLHTGCEACGMIGINAMITSAKKLNLNALILDYKTSADINNDTLSVVGYTSACFY